jgi:CubicO group peptidase (beta-lactamase class C family)
MVSPSRCSAEEACRPGAGIMVQWWRLRLWLCLLPALGSAIGHTHEEGERSPLAPVEIRAAESLDLDALRQRAAELPDLHSLIISQHGEIVLEEYFAGRSRSQPANLKSASKSIISALVGIAIREGLIEGVGQPIADFFPELNGQASAEKRAITVGHLLTMQSGLQSTSSRNYGPWVVSDNWVKYALERPLQAQPGTAMIYSTGSTHLLSAIIEKASGMSTRAFAQRHLADPLGFRIGYWSQDPQGIYFGGNDMEITPRQLLAFGQLYLDEGMIDGERLLPHSWIQESLRPHVASPRGQGRFYGYGWWLRDLAGLQVPLAWGYGGQLLFVVEQLDLLVVMTSNSEARTERRGHLTQLYALMEEQILAPLLARELLTASAGPQTYAR